MFIGDSITQAWPLEDYLPNAINEGVSGQQTAQMLARFQQDVLDRKPEIVVILGGINDIRNEDAYDMSNLLSMVQMANAANVRVIMGTLTAAGGDWGAHPELEASLIPLMNRDIKNGAAANGYTVVDYHAATIKADGSFNANLFQGDGLHPNTAGYDAMWAVLRPLLEPGAR